MMTLKLERFFSGADSTLGNLFVNNTWKCFVLEDQFQTQKVYGETRIPAGSYHIGFNQNDAPGSFNDRYGRRFSEFHKGMLELQHVPNFTGILIHIGNTDDDTAGCLLVGDGARWSDGEATIQASALAYKRIYPPIAAALDAGEDVLINIIDRA